MYPIIINEKPEFKRYSKSFDIHDLWLSLSELKEYVNEHETFFIDSEEKKIYVSGARIETDEEVNLRVERQKEYMKKYNEFHNKNKSKN